MARPSLRNYLSATAGLIVFLAAVGMLLLLVVLTRRVDADNRLRKAEAVAAGLRHFAEDQTEKSIPQAYWDEAVINLDQKFDIEWARRFIGDYLLKTGRIDVAAVADQDGKIRYFMLGGREFDPPDEPSMVAAAAPLIAAMREAEAGRGPVASAGRTPVRPLTGRRIARVGDRLVFLSGILVQPDRSARLSGARAPIVLSGKLIDEAEVRSIAERHGLREARLSWGRPPAQPGRNRIVFGSLEAPVATLEWRAERPGNDILQAMLPLLLLFVLALSAVGFLSLNRADRLAFHLERSERRARQMARSDPLTGLPNRSHFDRMAEEHLGQKMCVAVFCIDLDHFKVVNDTLGHQAGDELLRRAASILNRACRQGHCVARIGGDEFAMCLCPATRAEAAALAEDVIAAMGQPIDLKDGRVFIGASLGIAMVDAERIGPEEALRRADLALYRAKALGRSRFAFYDAALDEAVLARQHLQQRLLAALEEKSLRLFYQPQVAADGEVSGAEALLRWRDTEDEPVPIQALIGLAEETGLIERLGYFTIEQAFRDLPRFGALRVAINVSAIQLRLPDFVPTIERLAKTYKVDPHRVELELTESALLEDEPDMIARMERLKAAGFSLVLDDFGTGFSSLGYLRRFPIDKVKIDQSFIAELGRDEQSAAVVEAIIRLAQALRLDVVAEGVETKAQRRQLIAAGCPQVQGYLTGRPMSAEALAKMIARPRLAAQA